MLVVLPPSGRGVMENMQKNAGENVDSFNSVWQSKKYMVII